MNQNPDDIWSRIRDVEQEPSVTPEQMADDLRAQDEPRGMAPIALILIGLVVVGGGIAWFLISVLDSWLQLP